MLPSYCLDMSGFSTPLVMMPADIHVTLWGRISTMVADGKFATTPELYDELLHLPTSMGQCIKGCKTVLSYDVGDARWNWKAYVTHSERMKKAHEKFISEYNQNRKRTLGLNDLSGIAMAKTMSLPLISMETRVGVASPKVRKIPDICDAEKVEHLDFNDFLRKEGIKL